MKQKKRQHIKEYSVSRREYPGDAEYAAASRDLRKIERLQKETDMDNPEDVESLYRLLQSGRCRFETRLGVEFDDAIYEQRKALQEKAQKAVKPVKRQRKQPAAEETFSDEELRPMIERFTRRAEHKRKGMIACFLVLAIGCIGFFIYDNYQNRQSAGRFDELSGMVGSQALHTTTDSYAVTIHRSDEPAVTADILPEYETLYNTNHRLIGWIAIDDTIIDYPVLQCGDNEYYLNHNFDQKEDRNGSIFLDYRCDVLNGNDNYIIYGHHMSSGKMFAGLENYETRDYYEKHPYIRFDTIYEKHTYQVMYVFRSRVYNEEDVVFKYYDFIDANSEAEFLSYMNEMKTESFYDTGVEASYGDTLLTLSTCDYNEKNGRFVVVAKRIN